MVLFQVALDPTKLLGVDFFNFLLPWVLTFVLTYALLMKLKIFSDSLRPKISLALAFVFAFFVTASGGPQLAGFFMEFFGNATVYIIGVLVLAMFLSLVSDKGLDVIPGSILFWITIVIGVVLFLASGGNIPGLESLDQNTATLLFWGVILVGAIAYITQHKAEATNGGKEAAGAAARGG